MVEYNPLKWSKKGTAQFIYDTLDPIYGDGGVLEPVTVIVDPDTTVYEEYIEPVKEEIVDYTEDVIDRTEDALLDVEEKSKEYLKWAVAIGLLYVALK